MHLESIEGLPCVKLQATHKEKINGIAMICFFCPAPNLQRLQITYIMYINR